MANRSRILIADDLLLFADLCARLLRPEFDVVGIVRDGLELLDATAKMQPDLILLDLAMPSLNGLDAADQIRRMFRPVKLLILTVNSDPEVIATALSRGVNGYLLKTCACNEVRNAVRALLRGERYISSSLSEEAIDWALLQRGKPFNRELGITTRQREVLRLLAEGQPTKEIAEILCTTERTISFHKYRLMRRLGMKSQAELIRYALRLHLVSA